MSSCSTPSTEYLQWTMRLRNVVLENQPSRVFGKGYGQLPCREVDASTGNGFRLVPHKTVRPQTVIHEVPGHLNKLCVIRRSPSFSRSLHRQTEFNCFNNMLPISFNDFLVPVDESHEHNTKSKWLRWGTGRDRAVDSAKRIAVGARWTEYDRICNIRKQG